ncbi:MAG: aldo/keto reductase [Acidimicrobiia bacterium]
MGRLKDLPISSLGLGGTALGNMFRATDDATADATVDAAWDAGIRLFDTARLYGHGLSERRLGRALARRPRDEFVLSTKVGRLLEPGAGEETTFVDLPEVHPEFDYSAAATRRSFEESLERLGLDRVDVVLVHDPDDHETDARAGALPELILMRDEGLIGAVGTGMNQAEMPARFVAEFDIDCVLLAGRYTLLEQRARGVLLDSCAARDVDVMIGGVFNSGLLADPHRAGVTYEYWPAAPQFVERAQQIEAVCRRYGVALAAAALQFPLAHSAVAAVLTGACSADEIRENASLASRPIPVELWSALAAEGLLDRAAPVPGVG